MYHNAVFPSKSGKRELLTKGAGFDIINTKYVENLEKKPRELANAGSLGFFRQKVFNIFNIFYVENSNWLILPNGEKGRKRIDRKCSSYNFRKLFERVIRQIPRLLHRKFYE